MVMGSGTTIGCTSRGSCNIMLLRRVLRRRLVRVFCKDKVLRRVLRREPFAENDPLRVHLRQAQLEDEVFGPG